MVNAYLLVPATMLFAKCVPHSIEGLMIGFTTSIIKFNTDIAMRLVSLAFVKEKSITIENFDKLSNTLYLSGTVQLVSIFVLQFLLNRNEYYSLQAVVSKIDTMTP